MASSELVRRWAVALVGVPFAIGVLYLGGWTLAVVLAGLAGVGTIECHRLAHARGVRPFTLLGIVTSGLLVLAAGWRSEFGAFAPLALTVLGTSAGISLVLAIAWRGPEGHPLLAVSTTLFGAVYLGIPFALAILLRALPEARGWDAVSGSPWAGVTMVALPLACTWIGDAAAFFAGSAWGRGGRRLAPTVSPNKSWVGAWSGVAAAAGGALAWIPFATDHLPRLAIPGGAASLALLGAILGAGAIIGDLAESLLKREAGVKDSGRFFPGHGGVLDRMDALLFTLPVAYALLGLFGSTGS